MNSFDLDMFVKYDSFVFLVKRIDLLLNRIATGITRESSEIILKDYLLEII